MGKHYIRQRAYLNGSKPLKFTCTICGHQVNRKDKIKLHHEELHPVKRAEKVH